jgi:hypothetical protein
LLALDLGGVVPSNSRAERAVEEPERRSADTDRRRNSRSGRRKGDRRWPWWRQGIAFAAICAALRYWNRFKRTQSL